MHLCSILAKSLCTEYCISLFSLKQPNYYEFSSTRLVKNSTSVIVGAPLPPTQKWGGFQDLWKTKEDIRFLGHIPSISQHSYTHCQELWFKSGHPTKLRWEIGKGQDPCVHVQPAWPLLGTLPSLGLVAHLSQDLFIFLPFPSWILSIISTQKARMSHFQAVSLFKSDKKDVRRQVHFKSLTTGLVCKRGEIKENKAEF